jgi:hypothetical protein
VSELLGLQEAINVVIVTINAVAAHLGKGRPLKTEQVTLEASNVEKQANTLIAFAKP